MISTFSGSRQWSHAPILLRLWFREWYESYSTFKSIWARCVSWVSYLQYAHQSPPILDRLWCTCFCHCWCLFATPKIWVSLNHWMKGWRCVLSSCTDCIIAIVGHAWATCSLSLVEAPSASMLSVTETQGLLAMGVQACLLCHTVPELWRALLVCSGLINTKTHRRGTGINQNSV